MCNFRTLRSDGCFDLFWVKCIYVVFPWSAHFAFLNGKKSCDLLVDAKRCFCSSMCWVLHTCLQLMGNFTPLKVRWMLLSFLSLMRIWCFPVRFKSIKSRNWVTFATFTCGWWWTDKWLKLYKRQKEKRSPFLGPIFIHWPQKHQTMTTSRKQVQIKPKWKCAIFHFLLLYLFVPKKLLSWLNERPLFITDWVSFLVDFFYF